MLSIFYKMFLHRRTSQKKTLKKIIKTKKLKKEKNILFGTSQNEIYWKQNCRHESEPHFYRSKLRVDSFFVQNFFSTADPLYCEVPNYSFELNVCLSVCLIKFFFFLFMILT